MAMLSARKINMFLLTKLPAAYFCGVRVREINAAKCRVCVKHRWINQNPFRSMYFAVQAMAAELSTGALVMSEIKKSNKNISMLVGSNSATFSKKATGKITFTCNDGHLIAEAIAHTIANGSGQSLKLTSVGTDEQGDVVAEMTFEWRVKLKTLH